MREEIYGGRFLGELPDLYFLPSDPTQAVFGDFEFSSNKVVEPASEAISAQHRMDGRLRRQGPGHQAGRRDRGLDRGRHHAAGALPDGPRRYPRGSTASSRPRSLEAAEIAAEAAGLLQAGRPAGYAGKRSGRPPTTRASSSGSRDWVTYPDERPMGNRAAVGCRGAVLMAGLRLVGTHDLAKMLDLGRCLWCCASSSPWAWR